MFSTLKYDEETGRYTYWQYEMEMKDQFTKEPETFRNVVVIFSDMTTIGYGYHVSDFNVGGSGYYASGGKIIPITWSCDGDKAPFRFFTEAGEPVTFGAGNTYIAITDPAGEVSWTAPKEA